MDSTELNIMGKTKKNGGNSMKRFFYFLSCALILLCVFGCKKNDSKKTETSQTDSADAAIQSGNPYLTDYGTSDGIDIDMSGMNYNLVNAMNFDMAMEPENFYGKVIKMRGQFFSGVEPETNLRFYYCILYDATACCQAGIDFQMSGNKIYPDDFPPEGTNIEIVGTFKDFSDLLNDGRSYTGILCDSITVLD